MPKLDIRSSHEFWKNYDDPMIYRVVSFMEGVENWTVDDDHDLETLMDKIGDSLDNISNFELGEEENIIKLCVYLKTSRILRLLQAIDTIDPGSASKLLMYAEENTISQDDMPGLFLRRNIVFERLRLLARVFSNERFHLVMNAMENH